MPSSSKKQHQFMAAVAKNPEFAKKAGVPTSVGQEFLKADKGRKFSKGGDMTESKAMVKKEIDFMKKKGAPASMIKHEKTEAEGKGKGKKPMFVKGQMPKFAKGGAIDGVATKGKTKGTMIQMRGGK